MIRHGLSETNASGGLGDQNQDCDLTKEGVVQSILLGASLRRERIYPDVIFCSKMLRTQQTACAVFGSNSRVIHKASLVEIDMGCLSGKRLKA